MCSFRHETSTMNNPRSATAFRGGGSTANYVAPLRQHHLSTLQEDMLLHAIVALLAASAALRARAYEPTLAPAPLNIDH